MTVRIDRLVSEVVPQPENPSKTDSSDSRFDKLEQLRDTRRRIERMKIRTRAENFDD